MGPDSHLAAIAAHHLGTNRAEGAPPRAVDRPRFFADINQLELRLAIIDDRFERLASRADDAYQSWRRDTVGKSRELALRARALEEVDALAPHHRRRVAALLVTMRARVAALDVRHAAYGDRRARAAACSGGGVLGPHGGREIPS